MTQSLSYWPPGRTSKNWGGLTPVQYFRLKIRTKSPLGLTPDGDFFMHDFQHAVFGRILWIVVNLLFLCWRDWVGSRAVEMICRRFALILATPYQFKTLPESRVFNFYTGVDSLGHLVNTIGLFNGTGCAAAVPLNEFRFHRGVSSPAVLFISTPAVLFFRSGRF